MRQVLQRFVYQDLSWLVPPLSRALQEAPVEGRPARVDHDPVLHGPAAQLIDRKASRLARNVPQRHVDSAHRVQRHASLAGATSIAAREHATPRRVRVGGIGADQESSESVEIVLDQRGDDGDRSGGGADARDALVGRYFDQHRRSAPQTLRDDPHVRDLHDGRLPGRYGAGQPTSRPFRLSIQHIALRLPSSRV